jgi:hypothetical protein
MLESKKVLKKEFLRNYFKARSRWLMPIILVTLEAEIRRIEVQFEASSR